MASGHVSSQAALLPSHVQPLDMIRPPAIEPRYITMAPPPPGMDNTMAYSVAQPVVPSHISFAAPPPSHHLPPPGIPLGPPPLPQPPVQPPPPAQGLPVVLPGVALPAPGRPAIIAAAPPPTYPLPGMHLTDLLYCLQYIRTWVYIWLCTCSRQSGHFCSGYVQHSLVNETIQMS